MLCEQHLKYHTQINVRSTRGRNARGRKISGVEPFPGEDKVGVVCWIKNKLEEDFAWKLILFAVCLS